jgi:AcrR family transcriptional regulator
MTGPDGIPLIGRRDRKKSETRQALRDAAHRLFAERGFAHTTIDDITAAADVSRRTFFRYYASKDDLLRVDMADLLPVMVHALKARPAHEPPLVSILQALRTLVGADGPPALAASLTGPVTGLRARIGLVRLLAQWEQGIADALLTRWGYQPRQAPDEARLRAVVTACATTSALRSSIQIYRARRPGPGLEPATLIPIVEQAFEVLAAGCDQPPDTHPTQG